MYPYIHEVPTRHGKLVDDKVAIVENGMLSDRHMYAANKLMASQFPDIDGFHSTLLTGFPPISIGGGYMQDGNIVEFIEFMMVPLPLYLYF